MFYHFIPSRIIKIRCILSVNSIELGTWININSSAIPEASGRVYLVTGNNISVPMHGGDYYVELVLYEYDSTRRGTSVYQEVPSIPPNENYQEIPDNSGDGFQEDVGDQR